VHPSGEVSNFLIEDYDAVTKFMDAEMEKKRFRDCLNLKYIEIKH